MKRKRKPAPKEIPVLPIPKKAVFLSIFLITALGFALYLNSIKGPFLWDDLSLIKENTLILKLSNLTQIFAGKITTSGIGEFNFYRPLQMVTYMLNYSLGKFNPFGYHLTNVILHILTALCVYWLVNILFRRNFISLVASLLFVSNPLHTEAVSYISGRADPLSAAFFLLCLIFYVKNCDKPSVCFSVISILCFIFSLLSRETALIIPAAIVLYHYTFGRKARLKAISAVFAITLVYILLRLTALKYLICEAGAVTTFVQRLPGFFVAIYEYARLLFFPVGLHMEYGVFLFRFSDPKAIAGILILVSILVCAFKARRKSVFVSFWTLWFFITLIPSSNLYPLNAYMAEHWLYIPSIGFFALAAGGINYLYDKKGLRVFALLIPVSLIASYSYLTIKQNEFWRDPAALYKRTLKYVPESSRAYNNLGVLYTGKGKYDEVISLYKKALEANPNNVEAYGNLGVAYTGMGKIQDAIASYNKAIEIDPLFDGAYYNLARLYASIGKTGEAADLYKKVIEINPNYADAYNNLGALYVNMGRKEEAVALYNKAIEVNPNYANSYNNLAIIYADSGKIDEAITAYKKAMELNPLLADAYYNLASIYSNQGKPEEAIGLYKKTLQINPSYLLANNNMGVAYAKAGKFNEAENAYSREIELNPLSPFAYNNLANIRASQGRYEEAVGLYEKAIEIYPDYKEARKNLKGVLKIYGKD